MGDLNDKQKAIDDMAMSIHETYEEIRLIENPEEKKYRMDLFFIENLKPVYECLRDNADVRMIDVERFADKADMNRPVYVPIYVNKDNAVKMSIRGYPYKASALMKLIYGFTSFVGKEKLE